MGQAVVERWETSDPEFDVVMRKTGQLQVDFWWALAIRQE